jgi:D-serine deaminase-like pyridoxal phosphate-dependent protein
VTTIHDLPTPALLLDARRVGHNISAMADRCRGLGVALRPHLKTHKCVEVARQQRDHGARGVTVSTLAEAAVFADHGFDDITWAFPAVLGRIPEARALAERVTLRLFVDGPEAVDALERADFPLHVWIKIDCGYHRAGMDPSAPATLALARRIATSPRLILDGIATHSGHAYHESGCARIRVAAEEERRTVAALRARLAREGIPVEASVGSTPAMTCVEHLEGATEARPGNYVFYDAMQVGLGVCTPGDCGVTVLASVVSSQPGAAHCVVDAGALALSKDAGHPGPAPAMGWLFDEYDAGTLRTDAWLTALSQEHGKVSRALPVGTRVRILPNHSCLTVACFDEYCVVDGETVVDRWRIWRGR